MSSEYRVICMSHDPAFEVDHDWPDPEKALASIRDRRHDDHPSCDLVVGRWSGGPVELCCPGSPPGPGSTVDTRRHHHGWHRDPLWTDAGWLRLLIHAGADLASRARVYPCWSFERAFRLRNVLGVNVAGGLGVETDG